MTTEKKIGIIGLGYVGLPLAVAFGVGHDVTGYDLDAIRIQELQRGHDRTREVTPDELAASSGLKFTNDASDLSGCQIYIVTVPTPIDGGNRPNLQPMLSATETLAKIITHGDIVIYESTVYPGVTEEVMAPILESQSGLVLNQDFYLGYSPERINPGDKRHRIADICKVTSGSTPEIAQEIDALYRRIITAGTHMAPSIKVAEAAKVIENTQRDLNIALTNELAIIFDRLGIDTEDVLKAAESKWNFMPFRPGLVGGHCIGVDPYYLTHKAEEVGYRPDVILAGRRINNGMGEFVASRLIREMIARKVQPNGSRVLVLGLTFKENCPDLRNTRVVDVISALEKYGVIVSVVDPRANKDEANKAFGIDLVEMPEKDDFQAIVLSVAHDEFRVLGTKRLRDACGDSSIIYDLKHILPKGESDLRL